MRTARWQKSARGRSGWTSTGTWTARACRWRAGATATSAWAGCFSRKRRFTTSVGWACDLVVNYEIVLADGSLVNASKDQNPDLFLALKGGANNYGVVTRYDLATFPQGEDISVTSVSYDIAQKGAVFAAFTDLLDSSTYDPRASLVMGLLYSSESKTWKLSNSAVYSEPVTQPAVFEKLVSVPHLSVERNITTLAEFADETETPPL